VTPEQFLTFADPMPEPMLLLTGRGLVLAGNRAVETRLGVAPSALTGKALASLVTDPPDEVAHYLRSCSRSRSLVLGSLELYDRAGAGVPCRAEGTVLCALEGDREAILLMRLIPKESAVGQFVALNQRIEELASEVQRRRRAEEEAREHGERLRVTLHSIGDAVITTDPDGRVAMMNPVAERLTGWTLDEARGRPLPTVFHIVNESSRQVVENPALRALREGVIVGLANHTVLIAKDGTERPIDDCAAPIRQGRGPVVGSVLVFRDVTGRRQAEDRLRRSEQRFARFMHHLPGLAWIKDGEGRYVYANEAAEDAFRTTGPDLYGKTDAEVFPPEVAERFRQNDRQAGASGVGIQVVETLEHEDGTLHYSLVTKFPIFGPGGEVELIGGMAIDVTEQRRAEAAVRESEEKLRLLADTIPQLAWMARPDGHIFWYNRRWYEYTGTTPGQMEGWGWQSVHDPGVLPHVLDRWKGSIGSGEPFDMVFPLKGADGEFRPFLTRVNPLRDEEGRILYWFGTNTDISDIKRMEESLRQSEQRFHQLADTMPQIAWTARPDGQIDYLNRRWTEFAGLPHTVGNEGWGPLLHPDDAPAAYEYWAACVRSGAPFEMELRLRDRRRQTYRWHLIRTVAVPDATGGVARWFGTATDIHEQKRAEETSRYLAESSANLARVVDYESTLQKVATLAVPYFADWSAVDLVNDDGTLRRLAVAHQDVAKVALVHQLMREYPPDPESPAGAFAVLRTGQPQLIGEIPDEMLTRAAKDARHLDLIRSLGLKSYICVPLVASGAPFGVLTFATAESGRTYTESDLALATDLAQRAGVAIENTRLYQALRESDRRKDEFLATLAHELRNPLAPIRNSLQILSMPRVDKEMARRSREMMERQIHHLVRLVDDLLDVSRVMRGKIELRRERVELASVVARAVETVQPLVDAQAHQLAVHLPAESLVVDVDPVRLAQVVGNLLTNAAKYTDTNGHIRLTAERHGGTAVLRVRDDGIGIAKEMLPRIFELFVQVDHASTKAQGGLGIGLTLVKNLVEMHNGTVEALSEGLGQGSEFVLRLPIATGPNAAGRDPEPDPAAHAVASSGFRLLVVDDNQDAAVSLAMLLRLQGHEVRVAHSGPAALEMANANPPDVIFLDIGMPGMDGYEVARRLRQRPGFENVVLAALTGWGQNEDRRRTAEAGFNRHFVKPPDPAVIQALLAELEPRRGR
jgi:PAS domain S-box-containing protein